MKNTLIWLALTALILVGVFVITFPKGSSTVRAESEALFEDLPGDSEFAGSYNATREFKNQSWYEGNTYTPAEVLISPCVHLDFVEKMSLQARPDYEWVWYESGTIRKARYCLEVKE